MDLYSADVSPEYAVWCAIRVPYNVYGTVQEFMTSTPAIRTKPGLVGLLVLRHVQSIYFRLEIF